jgi:predicted nuclease of predicted toxin-antitoxin system
MKILLDTCVWGKAVSLLSDAGHDVIWAGSWEKDPGDREILHIAFSDNRILITLDKDFGELAILQGLPHTGIIRLVGFSSSEQGVVSLQIIEKYSKELSESAIITVDQNRTRIRTTLN